MMRGEFYSSGGGGGGGLGEMCIAITSRDF